VPRSHLYRQLDAASESAVSLLVAPAGAGKTVGVAGWLRRPECRHDASWVVATPALRPADLDVLIADAGSRGREPGGLLIVDDADLLPTATVHHLDALLRDAPKALHVMLLSRSELELTRLVPELLGDLAVVRGEALRLDDGEAAELVARHARTTSPTVTDAVLSLTRGWCAALVLAATSIGASRDVEAAATALRADASGGADRVAAESFSGLTSRQRHVLLAVASEPDVTADAARHLSHDPLAEEVLAGLVEAGLLVTRLDHGGYRVHPLLAEVTRRRVLAGGVDVARARATVLRAVELDLARGEVSTSFRRLVALAEADRAARVLEDHGPALVLGGHGEAVAGFVHDHPEAVDARPGTWLTAALERWLEGDLPAARHWLDGLHDRRPGADAGAREGRTAACAGLLRSRLGLGSVADAVREGEEWLRSTSGSSTAVDALLVLEVGVAHNWLGNLAEAEAALTSAATTAQAGGLPGLAAEALSHMALNQFMRGREHTCVYLADRAVAMTHLSAGHRAATLERCSLARDLVAAGTAHDAVPGDADGVDHAPVPDPTTEFWRLVLAARRRLDAGSLPEAERVLDILLDTAELPDHLRTRALVERGLLAALASAPGPLTETGTALADLGARAEAALVGALRATLVGDVTLAESLLLEAELSSLAQPPVASTAAVCRAQLLDARGATAEALALVAAAVTATEVRRTPYPFLGWSRHGTPVHSLLQRQESLGSTGWARDLARSLGSEPGLAVRLGTVTATPHERDQVAGRAVTTPALSPRERGVLNELARGATYADIAENLVVSENTVKSHVSSLYRKLGVSRRSEALAVARISQLL
jgi:ATP/maltotriose-dependent transcriptional regulator MalT